MKQKVGNQLLSLFTHIRVFLIEKNSFFIWLKKKKEKFFFCDLSIVFLDAVKYLPFFLSLVSFSGGSLDSFFTTKMECFR